MRITIFIAVLLLPLLVLAQNTPTPKNTEALLKLKKIEQQKHLQKEQRVQQYLKQKKLISRSFTQNGSDYSIIDVQNNKPVYYITHNAEAAFSVGINDLRPGGQFGLDLAGENARIGVWDRGLPLASHQEFQGRLLNSDAASEFSDHSTHVTGTIMAGGVVPAARGMCYRGSGRAFDWFQDTEEMIDEVLMNDMLISNHSYGVPGGWEGSNWFGNAGISTDEDYRFGFYDGEAQAFDNIAYNAPYYTIVVAAGNERGNSGDGTFPPDGPFDCITGFKTGKNVLTVGAVRKLSGPYTGPDDVEMSSFSSWGPVDDGRIKPDIVAPGVSIFSSVSGDVNNNYSSFQGTSMASPVTTGASALLNEAYFQFNGNFMKSATLKGLLIHTAREAGSNPGPDYSFGWGLVNASQAVEHIIGTDGVNKFIIESTLQNGEVFELELNPVLGEKITATLVWTDLAGTPVEASLDPSDPMLVNDLDMVIVDESGNEVLPWTLNRLNPMNAAVRANNSIDNVEKIDFDNPDPRRYFLRVTHKGNLVTGSQDFSLILDYTSEDAGIQSFYWIDDNGSWSDGSQWSNSSGGTTINTVPDANSKLIFDDNSFSGQSGVVTMDQDFTVAGIVALNSKNITFDLGGNTLIITGTTLMGSDKFTIRNGTILFSNREVDQINIDFDAVTTEELAIIIDQANTAQWQMSDNSFQVDMFHLLGGAMMMENCNITISDALFGSDVPVLLNIEGTNLTTINLDLNQNLTFEGGASNTFIFNDNDAQLKFGIDVDVPVMNSQNLTIQRADIINSVLNEGALSINDNIRINTLVNNNATSLSLFERIDLSLETLEINTQASDFNIHCSSAQNKASIMLEGRNKFCFDNLNITNVDLVGESVVSVGENSTVDNSENWFIGSCEDLLFADYISDYECEGALVYFENTSDGNVVERDWYVDGIPVFGDETMEFYFENEGDYEVMLEVRDGNGNSSAFTQTITIGPTNLEPNEVGMNATQLFSTKSAAAYQWYNYDAPIPGETGRTYAFNGAPGIYFVLTFDGDCNRRSTILDLGTSVIDLDDDTESGISVFPNPFYEVLNIQLRDASLDIKEIKLYNTLGESYMLDVTGRQELTFDISWIPAGYYYMTIVTDDLTYLKKLVKYE
ncbi:MAG: S8 family serine peptidase [Saprospiraceae bacterium]|nr:S8 family serine peptidase [Saprospiraceae bacterium]